MATHIGSLQVRGSRPSNPVVGDMYIDTSTDQAKVFDGKNFVVVSAFPSAPPKIEDLLEELGEMSMNEALTDKRSQIRNLAKFIQRSISENATSEPRSRAESCELTSDVAF